MARKTYRTKKQTKLLISVLAALLLLLLTYIATDERIADSNPIKQAAQLVTGKKKLRKFPQMAPKAIRLLPVKSWLIQS